MTAGNKLIDLLARLSSRRHQEASFLAHFFIEHGTEEQRQRYRDGLMEPGEILFAMSDFVFSEAADFELFSPIIEADVRAAVCASLPDLDLFDAEVKFRSAELPHITKSERAVMDALRYRLGECAAITARVHQARVEHPAARWGIVERHGAMAAIQFGPFELRREYAL